MRHTCQVFLGKDGVFAKRCGQPAVDFVAIAGTDISLEGDTEFLTTKVWMCAKHWDEYWEAQHDKS